MISTTLLQNESLPSTSSSSESNTEKGLTSMKCNDDPCNCPTASNFLLGQGGDIGFLYVIAGDAKYAQEFLPVVDYFRNTLHIPDSTIRQQDPDKYGRYKYALVTEPHLCKDVLLETTSFFDIILTVGNAKEAGSALNPGVNPGVNLVIPEHIRNPLLDKSDDKRNRMMLENAPHPMGVLDDPYAQDRDIIYWAKSVKVTALALGSPFATTIFMDSDNTPCSANYVKQIDDILEKAEFQDR